MSADADHWWRNRREASANRGDAWSGGGRAYREWMDGKPTSDQSAPARSRPGRAAGSAGGERPPNPRGAIRSTRGLRQIAEAALLVFTGIPLARLGRRLRLRALLGFGAAGLAVVVLLAPLAWAGRLDPCAAAEEALLDEAIGRGSRFAASKARVANWAGPDGKLLSRGRVGRRIAAEEHAGWPPPLGCTALFWRARAGVASFGGLTPVLTRALAAKR